MNVLGFAVLQRRRSVWPNISEQQLVEMCATWAEWHRRRLVLVFDGRAPEGRAACETVAARNADDWITTPRLT